MGNTQYVEDYVFNLITYKCCFCNRLKQLKGTRGDEMSIIGERTDLLLALPAHTELLPALPNSPTIVVDVCLTPSGSNV